MFIVKNSLRFALICGIFACLIFLLARKLGSNPLIDLNHLFADIILFGIFIFFGAKDFKKYRNNGILHFWQGMSVGFVTYLGATILFFIFLMTYFAVDPSLLADYKIDAIAYLEERSDLYKERLGDIWDYDDQVRSIENITTGYLVKSAVLKKLITGLFVTPVISIILRRQPK